MFHDRPQVSFLISRIPGLQPADLRLSRPSQLGISSFLNQNLSAYRLSRDAQLVSLQPPAYADFRQCLAGRNCAADCCTIAMGPYRGAFGSGPRPASTRLLGWEKLSTRRAAQESLRLLNGSWSANRPGFGSILCWRMELCLVSIRSSFGGAHRLYRTQHLPPLTPAHTPRRPLR